MGKKRVAFYDFARVFAIISISFNHAVNRVFDNYIDTQAEFLELPYRLSVFKAGISVFSRLGVPIFLMLTGALILSKSFDTEESVKRFYTHNWLRMLITTELWLAIYYWFIYYFRPNNILATLPQEDLIKGFISTLFFINPTTEGLMWYMDMIIPLYTLLPALAVFINKGYGKHLRLPIFFTFLVGILIYDINRYLEIIESEIRYETVLYSPMTEYIIYIVVGYFIAKGVLSKVPGILIFIINVGLFVLCVHYQLWLYEGPTNYLVSYAQVPLMLCAFTLFDLFRRCEGRVLQFFSGILSHISRRCFGIYFLHIIILELLKWYYDMSGMGPLDRIVFLQAVSVVSSLIIIDILQVIKPIRKYLFLVK